MSKPDYGPPRHDNSLLAAYARRQDDDKPYFACPGCGTAVPKMFYGEVHRVAECTAYHQGFKDGVASVAKEKP